MGYVYLVCALVLNAAANLFMKAGADRFESGAALSVSAIVANYPLLAGLTLFGLNVGFYLAALTRLNLSVAYPVMMAGGVLIVVTASALFLREPLSAWQVIGVFVIVAGIALLTLTPAS